MKWRTEKLNGTLDSSEYYNTSGNPTWITFFFVFSKGMLYEKPQYDTVFPGSFPLLNPDTSGTMFEGTSTDSNAPIAYTNYDPRPSIIGCVDDIHVCSLAKGECAKGFKNYINFESDGEPQTQTLFSDTETSEPELTHFLLSHALLDIAFGINTDPEYSYNHTSQGVVTPYAFYTMATDSSLSYITIHHNLPQDHWKEIVSFVKLSKQR